jgi:hypothetical protein
MRKSANFKNKRQKELTDFIDLNNTRLVRKSELQFLLRLQKLFKVKKSRDTEISSQLQGLKLEAYEFYLFN